MRQVAPEPEILRSLVERLTYKPGWRFYLDDGNRGQGCEGLTLTIKTYTQDSNPPHHDGFVVNHYFIVPAAAYNERSWQRWLFDQIRLVESHEAAEFFKIDGTRPYAPLHSEGNDPYLIADIATEEEASKRFFERYTEHNQEQGT